MTSAICFNLDPSKILSSGNGLRSNYLLFTLYEILKSIFLPDLTHYQKTNSRLSQTERVCRRRFQIWRKWQKVIQTSRKHCGKRWNCLLRAISPFPTVFSKGLFPRGVKGVIDKFVYLSKLKAFEDDKMNVTEKLKFVLGKVETLWLSAFSPFHTMYSKLRLLFQGR